MRDEGPLKNQRPFLFLWCLTIVPFLKNNLHFVPPTLLAALGISFAILRPHSALTLRAQTIVTQYETGIPGISKWYEARITNRGPWPVVVTRCDAVDDAGGKEVMVAYAIERWNRKSSHWDAVLVFNSSSFCKPYPLGIVEAQLKDTWLWPGQSLSTGEEITAARLHKGDVARFVVFTGPAGDYSHSAVTKGFPIDEELARRDVPFRVRH